MNIFDMMPKTILNDNSPSTIKPKTDRKLRIPDYSGAARHEHQFIVSQSQSTKQAPQKQREKVTFSAPKSLDLNEDLSEAIHCVNIPELEEMANEESVKRTHELQKFCESFCNKEHI